MNIMNRKYTKENLESVASKCFSFRQMISELGLKETGGNYTNIKNRCKEFGVNTSHFLGMGWNNPNHPSWGNGSLPLEEYFVKSDKKKPTSQVKKRILNNNLKEYKCERCGIDEWRPN